jgi:hypothetical protein
MRLNSTEADFEQSVFHTAQHNLLNITYVLGDCIKLLSRFRLFWSTPYTCLGLNIHFHLMKIIVKTFTVIQKKDSLLHDLVSDEFIVH